MTAMSKLALKTLWAARFQPTSSDFANLIDSWLDFQAAVESMRTQVSAGATGVPNFISNLSAEFISFSTLGRSLASAADATAARVSVLGAGAVGDIVFRATTTANAISALGAGAVGAQLLSSTTTASAVAVFGSLGLTASTTAQAVAATSADSSLTPLILNEHPDVPKAWGFVETTSVGQQIIRSSRGVATVSLIATGLFNITFSRAMASAGYAVIGMAQYNNAARFLVLNSAATVTAGGFQLLGIDPGGAAATPVGFSFVVYGGRS